MPEANMPVAGNPIVNIADARAAAQPVREQNSVSRTTVWLHRLSLVILVVFCVELGMLLAVLPWTPVWVNNIYFANHLYLKAIFESNFVRGVVSGVGLIDIWIGIREAVLYRDPGKAPRDGNA